MKKIGLILCSVVMLLIVISNVCALGITPARRTIDYETGKNSVVPISVLNSDHKNIEVVLMVQGELNKSIKVSPAKLVFEPSEESKTFEYKLDLPSGLTPGLHTAEVVALEVQTSEGGDFVGATVAVATQVHVNVPYPGKYLDADLNVLNAEQGGVANFIVPIVNRGKLGIGGARALIDVYNLDYEKKASIETDLLEVGAKQRRELSGQWSVDVNPGNYIAKVTLMYDGETLVFEKQFSVGSRSLSIESIFVNNFQLGQIAKLQILVENKWGEEVKGVFANLLVYNHENQVMADVKSSTENIPSLEKKELIAYWDTVGVEEGEYDGKLMVKYGQKSSDKNLVLKVSEDRLDVVGVGYAISPRGGNGVDITMVLLILVVILLVVNLAWFVFFKRINSKSKKARKK
ncbi:hypothetical protein GOV14_04435 [Candidatus Pacearchaeota archaeon]|nr:hypothetical protein [Candidatus Pacearchaeota archaeon]